MTPAALSLAFLQLIWLDTPTLPITTPSPPVVPTPILPTAAEIVQREWWIALGASLSPLAILTFQALLVGAITLYIAAWLRNITRRALKRASADLGIILLVGRLVYFAVVTMGAFWMLAIYGLPPIALVPTLGVVGLAVSLSLQDILKNLVAGLYLLVEKPFRIGDRLLVRTFDGVVESVDVRTTTLRMESGERVLIPNAILFAEVLINHGVPKPVVEPGDSVTDESGD